MSIRHLPAAVLFSQLAILCACALPPDEGKKTSAPAVPAVPASVQSVPPDARSGEPSPGAVLYRRALAAKTPAERGELFRGALARLEFEAEKEKNLRSRLILAAMYDYGRGVPENGILAAKHYRIAADSGDPAAKEALADFWYRNDILLPDAEKLVRSIPGCGTDPDRMLLLGNIQYANSDFENGFKSLKRAWELAEDEPEIRSCVLETIQAAFEEFLKNDNLADARRELDKEESLSPETFSVLFRRGLLELRRGKNGDAEKLFRKALKRAPAFPPLYAELAKLEAATGRFEDAFDNMKIACAISGFDPGFLGVFAALCGNAGKSGRFLSYADALIRREPALAAPYLLRGIEFLRQSRYREAGADLGKALSFPEYSGNPVFLAAFAHAASGAGDFSGAEAAYQKALAKEFDIISALNLAELYFIAGKYGKLLEFLEDKGFDGEAAPPFRMLRVYLKACALLASGRDAEKELAEFDALAEKLADGDEELFEWNTAMFEAALAKAGISGAARKRIASLTERIKKIYVEPKSVPASASAPGAASAKGK